MELTGYLQVYEWGKIGYGSIAAILYADDIDPSTPYAELWLGTHPNGNATIKEYQMSLQEYLEEHPEYLGTALEYWNKFGTLPFLLKVLSVRKALSIQVHPDILTAQVLHEDYPLLYKDPNHKPEMAIALTKFHALCGFRSAEEIKECFVNVTELQLIITPSLLLTYQETLDETLLKKILFSMLTKDDELVELAITKFLRRFDEEDEPTKEKFKYQLVKKLHDQFPADSGAFMVFFLNEVTLEPGEAMYIPPGLPHAYLSGDCVECMATSDNVVRAGLTPKYKDIETLLEILDYQSFTPEGLKMKSKAISEYTTHYHPPITDFGVSRVCIPEGTNWVSPYHDSCQVFFVLEGEGTIMGEKLEKPIDPDSEPEPEPKASCDLSFKHEVTTKMLFKKKNKNNEKEEIQHSEDENKMESENVEGENKKESEDAGDGKSKNAEETACASDDTKGDKVEDNKPEGAELVSTTSNNEGRIVGKKRPRESSSGNEELATSNSEADAKYEEDKNNKGSTGETLTGNNGESKDVKREPVTSSVADGKDKSKPAFEWGMKPDIKPIPRRFKDKKQAEREAEERRKYKTFLAKSRPKRRPGKGFYDGILDCPPKPLNDSNSEETAEEDLMIHEVNLKLGSAMFIPAYTEYIITPTVGPLILYFAYVNSEYPTHDMSCKPFDL